jgi:hypothetical protein
MTQALSPEEIDRLARRRARAKLGWFIHLAVYVGVNLLLFAFSEQGLGQRRWSLGPVLGWGLGLALHGISVWFLGSGSDLHQRMVQRERERLMRQQDKG